MKKGVIFSLTAYFLWGILPIYWKLLHHISAFEILIHRMVWSFLFCVFLLAFKKNWLWLKQLVHHPKQILISFLSAAILAVNWLTYIWAINHGFIVESSLGYYINPLINVLIGVIFLKEKLRKWQIVAIAIATVGVLSLTIMYGSFPWIALTLAFSFGFYALVRKTAHLESIEGLCVETGFQSIPAVILIFLWQMHDTGSFMTVNLSTTVLLFSSGAATALPLIFFAAGARKIPMVMLGLLQYVAPTMQFLIGVLMYGESFSGNRVIGFSFVWFALVLYSAESIIYNQKIVLINA